MLVAHVAFEDSMFSVGCKVLLQKSVRRLCHPVGAALTAALEAALEAALVFG